MAKTAFSQWDTVAANNTDINNIPLSDSMVADELDDAIRELMAQLASAALITATATLTVTSTDAGATAGPVVDLYRNSATPAASDILGKVLFNGEDAAGNTQEYASIEAVIVDTTSTSEDGQLDFYVTKAGARTKFVAIAASAIAFAGADTYSFTSGVSNAVTVNWSDDGAGIGPVLALGRVSASPAASDVLGGVDFYGRDSGGNSTVYARDFASIVDTTNGSEDGARSLQVSVAGTLTTFMHLARNAAGTADAAAVGLPLGQLSFPATQNASSDANTLDDYEEGSTAISQGSGITSGSGSITTASGTRAYTKTGRSVTVNWLFTISNVGTAGTSIVLTLPFAADASVGFAIGTGTSSLPQLLTVSCASSGTTATVTTATFVSPVGTASYVVSLTYFAAT